MRKILCLIALILGLGFVPIVSGTASGGEFYEGKTIRLIVFGSPGGGNDFWGRIIGRHMPRHIPGKPKFIVQNMPGAAGMIATNYLYNIAKPDGRTIGLIPPALYMAQLTGGRMVKFQWSKFGWIGTGELSEYLVYIRSDAGYKNLDDVKAASEPPPCAESGVGSMNYAHLRLLDEIFGVKFKAVLGYRGAGSMNMAIERGEAVCRSSTISAHLTREPTKSWFRKGFTRVLIQTGRKRHAALREVPTIWEEADKRRLSKEDRKFLDLVLAGADFGRPFVTPPGVSRNRLELLRKAFSGTLKDPKFLKEATRAGLEVNPKSGAELEKMARDVTEISPRLVVRLKKILK